MPISEASDSCLSSRTPSAIKDGMVSPAVARKQGFYFEAKIPIVTAGVLDVLFSIGEGTIERALKDFLNQVPAIDLGFGLTPRKARSTSV